MNKQLLSNDYLPEKRKSIYFSGLPLSLLIGISHGLADAAAGFLLGGIVQTNSLEQASWLIILYNVLGFGYQPVVGNLTDRFKCPRLAMLLGLFSLLWALIIVNWQPYLAVGLAGIGSAVFHVGGGSLALTATPNRTTGPGIFAAPGVVGLALGGTCGLTGYPLAPPLIVMLGVMIGFTTIVKLPKLPQTRVVSQDSEEYDWVMLGLITAIALVSTVWTSFQLLLQEQLNFLVILALAAALGKIIGGILAEYWGWQVWTITSLSLAALLLLFGQEHDWSLLLSLGLLQSTVPVTLAATGRMLPNQPATATSLALGLAILVGGFPFIAGLGIIAEQRAIASLLVVATILVLIWIFQTKTFPNSSK